MATQTGSIDLKGLKEAAAPALNSEQYFWHNSVDSGAGEGAGAHITQVPQDTFISDPTNGGGNLFADAGGIAVRDGLSVLASFRANGTTIGQSGQTRAEIDYHSLQLVDKEGNPYFFVSDLRNANGTVTITVNDTLGDTPYFALPYNPIAIISVEVNGSSATYIQDGQEIEITSAYSPGDPIEVVFTTNSSLIKAYTLGVRDSGAEVGSMSYAEGLETEASAYLSHAQGDHTKAIGRQQTVLGKYNIGDYHNALIIGNGTADNARSNALTVDWSGNVDIASGAKYKINGSNLATSDLTNDSGFVSSPSTSNIILKNNVRLQGRDTTDANTYSLVYVSTNNRGALGSTSIPTVLQGSNGNSSGVIIDYLGRHTQLYKVVDKEITVGAINAHSYQSAADYSISSLVPTNHVPVGIVGYTSDNYRIRPTTNYIKDSSTLNIGFSNASTSNVSAGTTVHVKILCLKATSA